MSFYTMAIYIFYSSSTAAFLFIDRSSNILNICGRTGQQILCSRFVTRAESQALFAFRNLQNIRSKVFSFSDVHIKPFLFKRIVFLLISVFRSYMYNFKKNEFLFVQYEHGEVGYHFRNFLECSNHNLPFS